MQIKLFLMYFKNNKRSSNKISILTPELTDKPHNCDLLILLMKKIENSHIEKTKHLQRKNGRYKIYTKV
jgi:hypothetical protein